MMGLLYYFFRFPSEIICCVVLSPPPPSEVLVLKKHMMVHLCRARPMSFAVERVCVSLFSVRLDNWMLSLGCASCFCVCQKSSFGNVFVLVIGGGRACHSISVNSTFSPKNAFWMTGLLKLFVKSSELMSLTTLTALFPIVLVSIKYNMFYAYCSPWVWSYYSHFQHTIEENWCEA